MNDTARRGGLDLATSPRGRRRCSCTTTSTAACGPATVDRAGPRRGYDGLPTTDEAELGRWFHRGAARQNLVLYLETFAHTVGVMQTKDALERVAAECAEDLAADGVVYAEVRFAPEQHLERGPHPRRGGGGGARGLPPRHGRAARSTMGTIVTAMRHAARSPEIAELAVRHRDAGVVGFDIAGSEAGNPPTRHLDAFQLVAAENFHITIHAGEAFGLPSIWEAVQLCGAERLGHGVRIVDDIEVGDDGRVTARTAGRLRARPARAAGDVPDVERQHRRVRLDRRAPDRPAAPAPLPGHGEHRQPADERRVPHLGDGRPRRAFGYGWDEIEWFTLNAMKSSFWPFDQRLRIINQQIKPAYAHLMALASQADMLVG